MNYVELHNHTFYSPLDGLSSPEEYFVRAKEIGIDKLAITDHGTVAGHTHFLRAALEANMTPVLGVEAYISETDRYDKRDQKKRTDGSSVYNHIILLAQNDQGIKDLNKLSEIGWTEGFYKKPRIDFEAISGELGDNLVVLSGCMSGLMSRAILDEREDEAWKWANKFKDRFGERFYVELQTHNPPELNHKLLQIADKTGIRPLITGDCHYADPEDKAFEEAFLILGTKPKTPSLASADIDWSKAEKLDLLDRLDYLYPDKRMRFADIDVFLEKAATRFKSMADMGINRKDLFENTIHASDQIDFYTPFKEEYTLPLKSPSGLSPKEVFVKICEMGMVRRGLKGNKEYEDRLRDEMKIIQDKNLEIYFVILADALRFCRENQIAYGAGRGSAAGSLVCFVTEITEVDPVEHKLLFWRFLDAGDAKYDPVFPLAL